MSTQTITLGAQTSGDDNRTQPHILDLRRLLEVHCSGPYSDEVKEFALILRVGGEMHEFDFEGCERVRRNRKGQYITVDVGFPSKQWRGQTDPHIREFLARSVEAGLRCCLERLRKDKTRVSSEALLRDFLLAKNLYLDT